MIGVTELRNGAVFESDGELWQVLEYEHIKMGRGSGNVKVQVRNLGSGSVTLKSYITGARVQEAMIDKRKVNYLYKDADAVHFMDMASYEQFEVPINIIKLEIPYFKENLEIVLLVYKDKPLGVELPRAVDYLIADTGPSEKGNTVSNVFKAATMENGLNVQVPLFTKVGDLVKVDTRSGKYLERSK